MPIEEITLSVPREPMHSQGGDEYNSDPDAESLEPGNTNDIASAFLKLARARDRFALTNRGRMRNRERFNQSLKAIVKQVAADASGSVKDRSARMKVRAQIYREVMQLATAMSKDQLAMIMRARTRLRWSLAIATVGLLGIALTLVINDIVSWPLGAQ